MENVPLDDILYIEGLQNYLRIYLPDRKIITRQSFRAILEQLSKIQSIERNRIKIAEAVIPVGEAYRNTFFERIKPNL